MEVVDIKNAFILAFNNLLVRYKMDLLVMKKKEKKISMMMKTVHHLNLLQEIKVLLTQNHIISITNLSKILIKMISISSSNIFILCSNKNRVTIISISIYKKIILGFILMECFLQAFCHVRQNLFNLRIIILICNRILLIISLNKQINIILVIKMKKVNRNKATIKEMKFFHAIIKKIIIMIKKML